MACKCPRLSRRIVVQRIASDAAIDAAGQIDESDNSIWETYTPAWAAIVAKASREFWGADQVQADITHQLTLRWTAKNDAIEPTMRIIDGAKIYNLTSAPFDPDGKRRTLKLNAVEVR